MLLCLGGSVAQAAETMKADGAGEHIVGLASMLAAGRQAAEVARLFEVHRATISRLDSASRQTKPA